MIATWAFWSVVSHLLPAQSSDLSTATAEKTKPTQSCKTMCWKRSIADPSWLVSLVKSSRVLNACTTRSRGTQGPCGGCAFLGRGVGAMSASLRNAVKRKTHKERSQPYVWHQALGYCLWMWTVSFPRNWLVSRVSRRSGTWRQFKLSVGSCVQ